MLQGKRFVKLLKYTFCFNMITYPSEENLTYQILTLKTGKTPKWKQKIHFEIRPGWNGCYCLSQSPATTQRSNSSLRWYRARKPSPDLTLWLSNPKWPWTVSGNRSLEQIYSTNAQVTTGVCDLIPAESFAVLQKTDTLNAFFALNKILHMKMSRRKIRVNESEFPKSCYYHHCSVIKTTALSKILQNTVMALSHKSVAIICIFHKSEFRHHDLYCEINKSKKCCLQRSHVARRAPRLSSCYLQSAAVSLLQNHLHVV